jgi:hypothetical protein
MASEQVYAAEIAFGEDPCNVIHAGKAFDRNARLANPSQAGV